MENTSSFEFCLKAFARIVVTVALPPLVILHLCRPLMAQEQRIVGKVDASKSVVVRGNVHPKARPEFDQGPVDPSMKLGYVTMAFKKSDAQEAALDQLLRQQQDPSSPQFRKWLTPEQYADRFGLNQSDIGKVVEWLRASGFTVLSVARGRDFIAFSGTAAQVEAALKTSIHRYVVDGEKHYANATEPSVPEAFSGLVAGFLGLDDFLPAHPKRSRPVRPGSHAKATPELTDPQSGLSYLTPSDLATIYDLQPLYQAGINGAGQSIVVAGQTNLFLADIEGFRQTFGLAPNDPQLLLVPGDTDPGIVPDQLTEADMDVELASAIAPGANIIFVYSSHGALVSAETAIDNALAPVITFSFSYGCERSVATGLPQRVEADAKRANAEGITWIVSAGDSGAAACENQNGSKSVATTGLSVNIPASLPEVTSVGGTEFAEGSGSYWGSNNSALGSALGYIPETGWNDSSLMPTGFASSGGGVSDLFAKPWWQNGPGVPTGGGRDVPDVAMTASGAHDPYAIMTGTQLVPNGGTSAAAPVFAGIVALLNQGLGFNGLGNINPNLYALAQAAPGVFHDITTGNNIVPCQIGSPDCKSGSFGYSAGPGYDQVTGLGSVDATNLVTNWYAMPYIAITALTSDTNVSAGGTINVSFTLQNFGGANAGPFRAGEFLSTSSTSLSNTTPFAYCDFPGLAAGATTTCSGPVTVPSGLQSGRYYLIAVADILSQLVQINQAQNYRLSDSGLVTVKAACSYSLSNSGGQFSAGGGSGSLIVQTQAGCSWTATSSVNWITISGAAAGTGSQTVFFSVAANSGPARTGTITAANLQFNVSQAAAAPAAVNVTLQFTNDLIYPAAVSANGTVVGTISASSQGSVTIPAPQSLNVSFELVRPTLDGTPLGDPMIGYWNTINNPAGTYTLTITNQIGSLQYFAPLISNTSGVPLLMDVNLGLTSENRCNCVVSVGGTNVGIGYYQLFPNSTVEAFLSTSNYSGQYSYFNNLGSSVQSPTGVLRLTFNQAP